jgi:hypothetical protein
MKIQSPLKQSGLVFPGILWPNREGGKHGRIKESFGRQN